MERVHISRNEPLNLCWPVIAFALTLAGVAIDRVLVHI